MSCRGVLAGVVADVAVVADGGVLHRRVRAIRDRVQRKWSSAGLGKRLEVMDPAVEVALRRQYKFRQQWPSTGLLSVIYALKYYEPPIAIAGFDFVNSKSKDCNWDVGPPLRRPLPTARATCP